MNPGRELDALIAEKVMGLTVVKNKRGGWSIGEPDYYDVQGELILANPLPEYSSDIAAAWQVVEELTIKGIPVAIYNGDGQFVVRMYDGRHTGETAPYAICMAAIQAMVIYEAP